MLRDSALYKFTVDELCADSHQRSYFDEHVDVICISIELGKWSYLFTLTQS